MQVSAARLPPGWYYPCSRKTLRGAFAEEELAWASCYPVSRPFRFDPRCTKRPRIKGRVVATMTHSPADEPYLILYPVPREDYSEETREEFARTVLPRMCAWLQEKRAGSATALSSHRELIVEWLAGEHRFHEVQYLYATS